MTRSLPDRLVSGDRGALARLISWAEDGDPRFPDALASLFSRVGSAWRIGITGPPGAGKSTLTNELARLEREAGKTVGILAVDPSSPFTGGALLGDRVRMDERTLDAGVYIRSMASRGNSGGLARAAIDACDVMDAFGFDTILLETVGVGQAEYDVRSATDTVLVVLCPGAGDGIQAMKAGLLEVADVLVVNKADLAGADRLVTDLEEALSIRSFPRFSGTEEHASAWEVPVVPCCAGTGEGVGDVRAALGRHRSYLEGGLLDEQRRSRRGDQVAHVVREMLGERLWAEPGFVARVAGALGDAATPHQVAETILEPILAAIPYPGSTGPVDSSEGGGGASGDA